LVFTVFLSFAPIFVFFAPFLVYESSPLCYLFQLILSACSPLLRSILNKQQALTPYSTLTPMILYLRGISSTHLAYVLDFMYNGEVSVAQDELDGFLEVAESLQIKGLTTGGQNNQQQHHPPPPPSSSSKQKTKRPQSSSAGEPPKRPKMTTPAKSEPKLEEVVLDEDGVEEEEHMVKMEHPIPGTSAGGGADEAVGEGGVDQEGYDDYGYDEETYDDPDSAAVAGGSAEGASGTTKGN
jgi:hypothetical protein